MGIGEESEPLPGNGTSGLPLLISSWPDLVTSDSGAAVAQPAKTPNCIVETNLLESGIEVEIA